MPEATTATPPTTPIQRSLDTLSDLAAGIAGVALLGLVVVQGWQVFARYVLNDSPSWTEPVTLLLLSTAMSMGAAAGVHTNRHFGFYLLAEAMRPGLRRVVDLVPPLVITGIGVVLGYWGLVLLLDGIDVRMAGAPLPQSITYLPLSVGGTLMALFALNRLAAAVSAPVGAGSD